MGSERVPDDLVLPPDEALALAQQMLDEGRPFHAHEVLEASWKAAPAGERDFWQGLAQLAVGLAHARRGNAVVAVTLLRRGADHIRGYASADPYGVPVARVVAETEELARQLGSVGGHDQALADGASLRLRP